MTEQENVPWLEKKLSPALPWLTVEVAIYIAVMLLAVLTRFYDLGTRVMSHDESLHTYFSHLLYKGQGYQHNPMMHGPLQFHLIALSYFMFGASDFTARIPAALFSVATVGLAWLWQRYIGKTGAIMAAILVLISPMLLYYGRYTREDPYVGVSLFLMLYAILRYFESGGARYIYIIAGSLVIHYLTKETAYIYTAQMLIFLAVYFIARVTRKPWFNKLYYQAFIVVVIIGTLLLGATGYVAVSNDRDDSSALQTAIPADPSVPTPFIPPAANVSVLNVLVVLTVLAIAVALYLLFRGMGVQAVKEERSFDLLIVFGTLVLPHLSAIPVYLLGWNPLDYSMEGLLRTGAFYLPLTLLAIGLGWWWNWNVWWRMAAVFWVPYALLYTTLFNHGIGFFSGTVGSLGYWLEQHGVERGSQPWYYYILIQIPIYEFLPFLASLLGLGLGIRHLTIASQKGEKGGPESDNLVNTFLLLGWWSITSIAAFTLAGEKMPWLTFHMSLPMALLGGWALGKLVDSVDWRGLWNKGGLLAVCLLAVFTFSAIGIFVSFLQVPLPFQGQDLAGLQSTTSLVLSVVGLLGSGYALIRLLENWPLRQILYFNAVIFFALLAGLTARASIRANYILYDSAEEYLVYAHSYTGVKDVLRQVADLSEKTTGGMNIIVAYDDDTSWPMSWYMREFPNARFYGNQPSRDLRDAPAVIVGDNNYEQVAAVLGDNYYRYDYIRMVWPNQDYFGLTWERFTNAMTDARLRAAIFDIWLNRDYKRYAEVTGSDSLVVENWQPSDRMRLYIRKDVAAEIWSYGASPVPVEPDPYEAGFNLFPADLAVGTFGSEAGQFNAPRGLAFARDGSFYVADSRNHRIQHFSADGEFINQWGGYGDGTLGAAALGSFNEPWGVAVGPDGSVYVTDTWNHRVQKFSPTGRPLATWGVFGLPDTPGALYGPRGITVDAEGRIFVADTGNERIVIYDSNGGILGSFGTEGADVGQFFEPVDVKLDADGLAYVTDTWNQRMQVFAPGGEDGLAYTPYLQWDIRGWFSESLDNKPFIAISRTGQVFVTDPEGFRVLQFDTAGNFIRTWGEYGQNLDQFGLVSAVAIDSQGRVWVTDPGNNRVMRFLLP